MSFNSTRASEALLCFNGQLVPENFSFTSSKVQMVFVELPDPLPMLTPQNASVPSVIRSQVCPKGPKDARGKQNVITWLIEISLSRFDNEALLDKLNSVLPITQAVWNTPKVKSTCFLGEQRQPLR